MNEYREAQSRMKRSQKKAQSNRMWDSHAMVLGIAKLTHKGLGNPVPTFPAACANKDRLDYKNRTSMPIYRFNT